jgi:NAD(P)-dependent dehydrogenase (short-subunit alcohol dehydrogenase family)
MRKPVVLITGANGEIGHALVANLVERRHQGVISLDVNALDPHIARLVHREFTGSILDVNL